MTTILVDQLTIIANPKLIRWINTTSVDGQLRGTKVHIKAKLKQQYKRKTNPKGLA